MCGFVVFVGTGSEALSLPVGLGSIAHRGPDDTVVTNPVPEVTMGFQRLAIVDLDGSRQPLTYGERWDLVFNGEIYNFRELRDELTRRHGCTFATEGDAEVLAAAFHVWGTAAVQRLRGMYAYVLWDRRERVLHAARDPFGIKPLYYRRTSDGIWLASEKKAIPCGDAPVDHDALAHYLSLQYVPEPHTLTQGVHRLPAGCALTYVPGFDVRVTRHFTPTFTPSPDDRDVLVGRLQEALRDSVRAHLVADVPVGAFLSGGVDSTAIVALARQFDPDLMVFSAGFDVDGYSELDLAAESAAALGVRFEPVVVTAAEVAAALPKIVWHLDDPVADPALTPLYFLARRAAQHVKVVLSGEGADELFGGYRIYREPFATAPVERLPDPLRRALRRVAAVIPEGVKGRSYLHRATVPLEERYYGNARIFDGDEKQALLLGHPSAPRTDVTDGVYAATAHLDPTSRMQLIDLHTWLPGDILTKADRMSMAHSLELRVPYLDQRVFEVAASVPAAWRVPRHGRSTKQLFRDAVAGLVPPAVTARAKVGFATPTRVWLRGELAGWAHDILSRSAAGHLIDLGRTRHLLTEHQHGDADNSRKVWTVLMFCLWYEVFITGAAGTAGKAEPNVAYVC